MVNFPAGKVLGGNTIIRELPKAERPLREFRYFETICDYKRKHILDINKLLSWGKKYTSCRTCTVNERFDKFDKKIGSMLLKGKYGPWTILDSALDQYGKKSFRKVLCICDCGERRVIARQTLLNPLRRPHCCKVTDKSKRIAYLERLKLRESCGEEVPTPKCSKKYFYVSHENNGL